MNEKQNTNSSFSYFFLMSRRSIPAHRRTRSRRTPNRPRSRSTSNDGIHGVLSSNFVRTCRMNGYTFRNKTVKYSQLGSLALFEGDINLSLDSDSGGLLSRGLKAGLGFTKLKYRWPTRLIPYAIDEGYPRWAARELRKAALLALMRV